jgi:hypothetical protein
MKTGRDHFIIWLLAGVPLLAILVLAIVDVLRKLLE